MPPIKKELLKASPNVVAAYICPTCGVRYEHGASRQYIYESELRSYLQMMSGWGEGNLLVEFAKPLEHCRELAFIGANLHAGGDFWTPLKCLFSAFDKAEQFVHVVTYSMDIAMCGALALLAQRVEVRGVVGVANEKVEDEIKRLKLNLKVYKPTSGGDVPHQKVVVVDGVLAFTGSANLSTQAWQKAGPPKQELVEAVTDLSEVIALNNTYFAKLWAQLNPTKEGTIQVTSDPDDIPF